MRFNDAVIGSVLLLLSLAVLWHIRDFPAFPGQPHGPALFPGVIASGLALSSLLLIHGGLRDGSAAIQLSGSGRALLPFATTVAGLFFYYFLAERLGFLLTASVVLVALLASYGVRRALVAPIAMGATLVIHTAFYKLLKVPLPWGVLQRFAW